MMDHCPRCGSQRITGGPKKWECFGCGRWFTRWTRDVSAPHTLGEYLAFLRGCKAWRTKDVGPLIGTSAAFVSLVELGRRRPDLQRLELWIRMLDGDWDLALNFWENWDPGAAVPTGRRPGRSSE